MNWTDGKERRHATFQADDPDDMGRALLMRIQDLVYLIGQRKAKTARIEIEIRGR
jgi:hypothetical protein